MPNAKCYVVIVHFCFRSLRKLDRHIKGSLQDLKKKKFKCQKLMILSIYMKGEGSPNRTMMMKYFLTLTFEITN